MKNPPHPGIGIRDEIVELGLSVAEAAKGLGVTRQQLPSRHQWPMRDHARNGIAAGEVDRQQRRFLATLADQLRPGEGTCAWRVDQSHPPGAQGCLENDP